MVKYSVFISSLIIAVLFYSGLVTAENRNHFITFADKSALVRADGLISSNPVKTSLFSSTYRATFRLQKVYTENAVFGAKGDIILYFPCEIVESLYPGKLYSLNHKSGAFLIENGVCLSVKVQKIQKSGFKDSFLVNEVCQSDWREKSLWGKFLRFRALCRLNFKRLMYAWGKAGGFLLALLSGSREYTEQSVSASFRNSGLSHILALSGMHLGLFGSLAHFFGKRAGGRNFGDALQLAAVLFFVWFAGLSPSLFRAFLAALILFINSALRMNRPDSLSLLSLCFILHVIIFPLHVYDAAFMLSYSSLGGIIIFNKMFKKVYPAIVPYRIRNSLSDSSAAQLATMPVSLSLFGKIMPQGIIASLFVSPLVFIFLYLGLFGVILCLLLPFLSGPISAIMNVLYLAITKLVLLFSFNS